MHELSMMQSILDIAIEYAVKYNAKKITKINLEIGELSGIISDWMQRYFDFVSEGSIAEKAELVIERIPAKIKCKSCGKEFTYSVGDSHFSCADCGAGSEIEILSGREYAMKSIEVD
jgi:hydrogenase nickel incorporation protein HypA/HybF